MGRLPNIPIRYLLFAATATSYRCLLVVSRCVKPLSPDMTVPMPYVRVQAAFHLVAFLPVSAVRLIRFLGVGKAKSNAHSALKGRCLCINTGA